jgi:hypothetical protein
MDFITSIDAALSAIVMLLKSIKTTPPTHPPKKDPKTHAIKQVWEAVDETRIFLASVKVGEAEDNRPNPHLVKLWSEAALAIADIDSDLADRLRMKAEYWSDPTNWDSAQVINARIAIDEVATETRRLLARKTLPKTNPTIKPHKRTGLFICHASEDKLEIAEPLADALTELGYKVWYDKYTLKLGDSLRREIDKGLAACEYGVVILSNSFFEKEWPIRELDGLVALETGDGKKRILPVWHNISAEDIRGFSPTLSDRLGVSTSRGMQYVVSAIVDAIQP